MVTAVEETNADEAALKEQADDHEEHAVNVKQSLDLIKGLKSKGFEVKKPFAKNS